MCFDFLVISILHLIVFISRYVYSITQWFYNVLYKQGLTLSNSQNMLKPALKSIKIIDFNADFSVY